MTQPPISSLIRRYSMKAEHESPNNPLTQALSSTIKERDDLERQSQRQAEEWTKWLKFGEATE